MLPCGAAAKAQVLDVRPVVAVCSLWDRERSRVWMLPAYLQWLERAGAAPVVLTPTEEPAVLEAYATQFDGFLFPGGEDIAPDCYGAARIDACGPDSPERDRHELALLRLCVEHDRPVFGICRGLQALNTVLGGTLYQDMPSERPTGVAHRMERPYDRGVHPVEVHGGTQLAAVIGAGEHSVNSLHHQAVRDLAPALTWTATSGDGFCEGVELPGRRFCMAVQWHPEYMPEEKDSQLLAAAFVAACQ